MKARWLELLVLLKAERRKAGMLGMLIVVLAVLGIRNFVSGPPQSARGAPVQTPGSESARESLLSSMTRPISFDALLPQGPITRYAAPPALERNIFVPDESYFPAPAPSSLSASPVQTDPAPDAARKSEQGIVEETVQSDEDHEARRARVAKEAEGLRLKSTIVGQSPIAVLEVLGRRDGGSRGTDRVVLRPGQSAEGFTLVEVRTQTVVLEKEGIQIELSRELPENR